MRSHIALGLLCSMAFATTIKEDCKPKCMKDCMEVGNGDKEGTHCRMVFGLGQMTMAVTNWEVPCQSACERTCNIICMPKGEVRNGEAVAEDRKYGFYPYPNTTNTTN